MPKAKEVTVCEDCETAFIDSSPAKCPTCGKPTSIISATVTPSYGDFVIKRKPTFGKIKSSEGNE